MFTWLVWTLLCAASPEEPVAVETEEGIWTPIVFPKHGEVSPAELHSELEHLAGQSPDSAHTIQPWIWTPEGIVPFENLLPTPVPHPGDPFPAPEKPITHAGYAEGALSGKALYLSQCHGFQWYNSINGFTTQRGNLFDTVEDFHNPEGMNFFLSTFLENAGGMVYSVRERDHHSSWAIVDNDDAQYAEIGNGFRDGGNGFATHQVWAYGENPFEMGSTRAFPGGGEQQATWTLTAPGTGEYALYVSWQAGPDHSANAHYRITWPGGERDRFFDQRVHGSTWQFVGMFPVRTGDTVTITLLGDTSASGTWLSADAVRMGGGSSVISRKGELVGRPRWEESAVLATQFNGAPTSVYDPYSDDYNGSDPPTRSRWAKWAHPKGEDALYLSWHSNATANGNARGTVTYIYEGSQGPAVAGSEALAWAVQDQMAQAFQELWEPDWYDRGVKRAAFAEVNPSHNDEMPAALVELAFHDNAIDVEYLKDPLFRLDASRAMYRGIVQYFAERDGIDPIYLPEPPSYLSLVNTEEGLQLSWEPGSIGAPFGDAPTSYIVQSSADGFYWSEGFTTTETRAVLETAVNETVFARVIAVNAGGRSFASEVVGGMHSADGSAAVLIVDAFDRFASGQLYAEEVHPRIGFVDRLEPHRVNPHDIVVPHGLAIQTTGWPFDSVSDEALDTLTLSDYPIIIWATGEESTIDETVSSAQQVALTNFWEGGGGLFISGAEVLWDLDYKGSETDRAFAATVLGASLEDDDANTTEAVGVGLLEGVDVSFPDETSPYPVEWPDVLQTSRTPMVQYPDGRIAGTLDNNVALLGYPFEAIGSTDARATVMAAILTALAPDYTPPMPATDTGNPNGEVPEGGCACASIKTPWYGFGPLCFGVLFCLRRRFVSIERKHN